MNLAHAAFAVLGLILSLSAPLRAADDTGAALRAQKAEQLFQTTINPLLKRACTGCHGEGAELAGALDLRDRAKTLVGGDTGPGLVPGDAKRSLIYQAVLWDDEDLRMPPQEKDRLAANEIAALKSWIDAGAPWPTETIRADATKEADDWSAPTAEGIRVATSGGQTPDWTDRRYKPEDIWAYRPVARVAVPRREDAAARPGNEIDNFLAVKLAEAGFKPAPDADRLAWLRRATLDLTGLPPTQEETELFLADDSPQAFARVVDRLLASPRYGEQQARHWLDVVRYADSSGFSNDYERPHAWRYRDYVIRSFNADKPFDRFVREQIAGDELDPRDPEMLIAVGFLRMGPWEHTGMSVAAVTRQLFLDDVTNSVGVSLLGQGLRCASCHDHKFDPIPTRDYYRLQAVFAPVQFAERPVALLDSENQSGFAEARARVERRLADARAFSEELRRKNEQEVARRLKERGVAKVSDLPPEERSNSQYLGLSPLEKSLKKIYEKRIAYFERELERYEPTAMSLYDGPPSDYTSVKLGQGLPQPAKRRGPAQDVFILAGGALEAAGERVTPGVLSAVGGAFDAESSAASITVPESLEGRRLALARWIANPDNSLTARAIVNRVWQQHFGRGLVATPNNFGRMGARPTHPELLDWLATWFVEHDWSIKRLHRLIMLSAAYRASGEHPQIKQLREKDPQNNLWAYYPVRRLAAEEIRDSMLLATGELNLEMGGPGVYPEINWEIARQPRHIMGSVAPAYQPSLDPAERHRRAIYAVRLRTLVDPMLEVFNRPNSEVSCERRDATTVAPQAFALLNAQEVHDRALALAARASRQYAEPADQIDCVFRLVYGRAPNESERADCLVHVEQSTQIHRQHQPTRMAPPTTVRREMIEELTGEPFQWDEPLEQMADFKPDLKPWDVSPEVRGLAELCLVLFNSNEFLYVH